MYTIKHAAEVTGVPVATLRAWERRYGVVTPQRTAGGYRLYDDAALGRLRAMRDLVAAGWAPRQAADEVTRANPPAARAAASDDGAGPAVTAPPPPPRGPAPADDGPAGLAQLLGAARALDAAGVAAVLDEHLARGSFEQVVDDWLMPALRVVGDAWARREISTAAEHLVAHAVLRRLATAFEAAAAGARGPRVVVGLGPGSRHELGALAFAVAARRAGLTVTYLGADLPVASWLDALDGAQPDAVVLAVPRRRDVAAAAAVTAALRAEHPGLRVFAGGGAQDADALGVPALGHRIGPAADRLAGALAGAPGGHTERR